MKIFDCFMFYDEEMILDFRLNYLNKYVDKFVIVESSYTHSGKKRELQFDIQKYGKFKDKITAISKLKKNINIFICPILPARSSVYNARAIKFNKLIYSQIIDQNYFRCSIIDVTSLCDSTYRTDLLDTYYSRGDSVHLNHRGTRKLAMIIKDSIYVRYNSGKGSRIDSKKPYNVALQDGLRGSGTPAVSSKQ